jgi:cytochrome c-type biogenesis protein CcmH
MTAFLLIATLLTLAALTVVLWPLWKKKAAGTWRAATLAAVAMPVVAASLYYALSNWTWDPADAAAGVPPEIEKMVSGLETRLRTNPTDVAGWLMLGRSYFHLQRYVEAADAFQQAYTLTQARDIDAVIGLAESLAFADENMLLGPSAELFDQAYQLSPDNPKVLWYTGLVGFQSGRKALARERWAKLVALEPPPEVKQILQKKIAEIELELAGVAPGSAAASASTPAPGAAGDSTSATQPPVVKVRVALAPELAGRAPPDAPLFVLVRAGEGGGPPIAVTRRTASQLPLLIELTDRDAMIAGRGLSSGAGALTVVARIARSGAPTASSGDLEGRVSYDLRRTAPADLVIDSIVP